VLLIISVSRIEFLNLPPYILILGDFPASLLPFLTSGGRNGVITSFVFP
jgi:hypothetical protein